MSAEEEMYRGELQDFLWLEIQACHAERTLDTEDTWLCSNRAHANHIVNRFMEFTFQRDTSGGPDSGLGK